MAVGRDGEVVEEAALTEERAPRGLRRVDKADLGRSEGRRDAAESSPGVWEMTNHTIHSAACQLIDVYGGTGAIGDTSAVPTPR